MKAEIVKPLVRAIKIYSRVSNQELDVPTRRGLALHMKRLAAEGLHDPSRLTVCGLSYLRTVQRRPH